MATKRVLTLKLTRGEAEALVRAGYLGAANLSESRLEGAMDAAVWAEATLGKLQKEMRGLGWRGAYFHAPRLPGTTRDTS